VPEAPHELAATERCLRDDLAIHPRRALLPLTDLRDDHPVIKDFLEKRARVLDGQEPIRDLLPKIVAFSLHTDHHRSATWSQRSLGVVWLLGSGIHREGQRTDPYKQFVRLRDAGTLLPTKKDVERIVDLRHADFVRGLQHEVAPLVRAARDQPGRVITGLLGGRIRVRVAWEDGILTVAASHRVVPGALEIPGDWWWQLGIAFFPNDADEISPATQIGGRPLGADEEGFCYFAD
jgi:hypothetical protein